MAALVAAREAGLAGDFAAAFDGARLWIDEVTDPANGRVGYNVRGSHSARIPENERFPREFGEALTAAGLFVLRLAAPEHADPFLEKRIELLKARPPVWDPERLMVDEYYFFYGAQALALCDARTRETWDGALRALARAQSGNANEVGSWDPVGAWAELGGRAYSTALLALALQAPYRYALADGDGKKPKKRK